MSVYTVDKDERIFHPERDCPGLINAVDVERRDREDVEDTHRECERCRYAWVPTLD